MWRLHELGKRVPVLLLFDGRWPTHEHMRRAFAELESALKAQARDRNQQLGQLVVIKCQASAAQAGAACASCVLVLSWVRAPGTGVLDTCMGLRMHVVHTVLFGGQRRVSIRRPTATNDGQWYWLPQKLSPREVQQLVATVTAKAPHCASVSGDAVVDLRKRAEEGRATLVLWGTLVFAGNFTGLQSYAAALVDELSACPDMFHLRTVRHVALVCCFTGSGIPAACVKAFLTRSDGLGDAENLPLELAALMLLRRDDPADEDWHVRRAAALFFRWRTRADVTVVSVWRAGPHVHLRGGAVRASHSRRNPPRGGRKERHWRRWLAQQPGALGSGTAV